MNNVKVDKMLVDDFKELLKKINFKPKVDTLKFDKFTIFHNDAIVQVPGQYSTEQSKFFMAKFIPGAPPEEAFKSVTPEVVIYNDKEFIGYVKIKKSTGEKDVYLRAGLTNPVQQGILAEVMKFFKPSVEDTQIDAVLTSLYDKL